MVKLGALLFGLLLVVAEVSAQQTVKVMPFGASIVSRCWRANLQAKLRNDKITNFDFIGSQRSTCGGADIDQDHEGHPGSQAVDYAAKGNLTFWLNQNPPDIILMLLGTNDVLIGKKSIGDILKAYDTLIGQMRAKNSKMHIIFSNLLPLDTARWTQTAADGIINLNAAIKQYAPTKSTRDSPVTFVDNFTNFDPVMDTADGEHPNDAGNEKIATQFFEPIRSAIKAIYGADAEARGQAQAALDQLLTATYTLITPTVKSTALPESTSVSSSSRAQSTSVAASASTPPAAQLQATDSATPETKTNPTQSTSQTSPASSLGASWPLGVLRNLRWAITRAGSRQSVLSMKMLLDSKIQTLHRLGQL